MMLLALILIGQACGEKAQETTTEETNGKQILVFIYKDVRTQLKAEYDLFDLNAIIGSVGGSMGLFLGWSFADIVLSFAEKFWSACMEKKGLNKIN